MSAMQRWLPYPFLSVVLFAIWVLLVNSIAPGQLLLAALFALVLPPLTSGLWHDHPTVRRPGLLLILVGRLLMDIVVANLRVAAIIANPKSRPHPAFVEVPLELRDPFAITLLANAISLTPGTVTVDVKHDHASLLVHSLDVDNEQALVDEIKQRYETPLKEIFEC